MKQPLYFDYMATTPMDPRIVDTMGKYLTISGNFANPASQHTMGYQSAAVVESARVRFAEVIGAMAEEVVWTSGATEANNMAIKGASRFYRRQGNHLITMKTEHKAVLDCFVALEAEGFDVTYLDPQPDGLLNLLQLQQSITPQTVLVSVMLVNNEIGVIQPIAAIAELLKSKGIILHVDAAQALGKVPVSAVELGADLISFSAHKCYGPKGIGALYLRQRPRIHLLPLLHGGSHERGLRPGTLATHQIVAMAEAAVLAECERVEEWARISDYAETMVNALEALGRVHIHGSREARVPHNVNFAVADVDGESLRYGLSRLCVSSTSACASASSQGSHVIQALGVSAALAQRSIRLSMGRFTTAEDVANAVSMICSEVQRLRGLAPC